MSSILDNAVKDVMTPEKRKRAAVYCRVSTDEQAEKFGLVYQRDEILAWAKYHPHPNNPYLIRDEHIFVDDGYSGICDVKERPALFALFEAARKEEIDTVLIWKIDRLSRKNEFLLRYIRELDEIGVIVISVTQPEITNSGSTGKLLLSILGSLGEIERDHIIERTGAGKMAAARAGKWVGGQFAPYGLNLDDKRQIVINEKEAAVVRQIFDWFVNEERSTYDIQQRLHEKKIITKADTAKDMLKKNGQPMKSCRRKNPAGFWSPATIVKLLKQEAYTGQYYYGKHRYKKDPSTGKTHMLLHDREHWVALPCPQIIDGVLWQKAQDRLANNKRFARKNRIHEYMFSGKTVCEVCNSPYVGYTRKRSRKKKVFVMYSQYRCRKSNKSRIAEPCKNVQISEKELERHIWPRLYEFLSDPQKFLHALQQRERRQEGAIELRTKQKEIGDRLLVLQKERERVCYLYEKGIGYQTEGDVERRFEEIEEECQRLRVEEQRLCKRVLTREEERNRLQSASVLSKRFKKSLNSADFALKKEIIQLLVHRIVVADQSVHVELKIPKKQSEVGSKMVLVKSEIQKGLGGGAGEDRTRAWGICSPLPYCLATAP